MKLNFAFSKVSDGNMSFRHSEQNEVISNREKFLSKHNLGLDDCVAMYVVDAHQNIITEVGEQDKSKGMNELGSAIVTDVLITTEPDSCLFLVIADCIPLILFDQVNEVLALAHLGWVDTDQELARFLVDYLQTEFNSKPEDLQVVVGPCLHQKSYRYKDPRQKTEPENFSSWKNFLKDYPDGTTGIGNLDYCLHQLQEAGVSEAQINNINIDTFESDEYFSHYRDAQLDHPDKGRFAAVCWMSVV